ncbi:hypothetical protein D3C80_1589790 [compost metagenome]
MHKAKIDIAAIKSSFISAFVYAGSMDNSAGHSGFVHIDFSSVKPSLIIDHSYHEFNRIVHLEVKALVAFNGIGGRVRLAERIACKGFDLAVDFLAQCFGMPFCCG